jgi:hypothetical protein
MLALQRRTPQPRAPCCSLSLLPHPAHPPNRVRWSPLQFVATVLSRSKPVHRGNHTVEQHPFLSFLAARTSWSATTVWRPSRAPPPVFVAFVNQERSQINPVPPRVPRGRDKHPPPILVATSTRDRRSICIGTAPAVVFSALRPLQVQATSVRLCSRWDARHLQQFARASKHLKGSTTSRHILRGVASPVPSGCRYLAGTPASEPTAEHHRDDLLSVAGAFSSDEVHISEISIPSPLQFSISLSISTHHNPF